MHAAYPGKLVAIEGIDAAGKTSVISLLEPLLTGSAQVVICREKQSPLAALLSNELLRVTSPFLKTYLFAADRAITYERTCMPALQRGALVLWDRYTESALVYRKIDKMLSRGELDYDFVIAINTPFRSPDLTIVFDIDESTSLARQALMPSPPLYDRDFLALARQEYLSRGHVVIDASASLDKVTESALHVIRTTFPEIFHAPDS